MIDSKKNILLFLPCFVTLFSVAQQIKNENSGDSYRAIHLTVQNGASAYGFHAMIKDSKVFMWIGSTTNQGELCRFDGETFKKYIPDPQKSASYFSPALVTHRHYNKIKQRNNFESVATR